MKISEILNQVSHYKIRRVLVTGGEPLAQVNCLDLLTVLCDQDYQVSVETSGAIDVSKMDSRAVKVIDIKTPGSGEVHRNLYKNLEYLLPGDQIKFVLCDREDYDWSKTILKQYELLERCEVLFSPSYQQLSPTLIADWILEDRLPVRLQIQLHKFLWGDIPGK